MKAPQVVRPLKSRAPAGERLAARIKTPADEFAPSCRHQDIQKLGLLGSVRRDDFTPRSEVDVLVEFECGYTSGLAFFGALPDQPPEILGRQMNFKHRGVSEFAISARVCSTRRR